MYVDKTDLWEKFLYNKLILALYVIHQVFCIFKYLKIIYPLLWALLYSYGIIIMLNCGKLVNCLYSFPKRGYNICYQNHSDIQPGFLFVGSLFSAFK